MKKVLTVLLPIAVVLLGVGSAVILIVKKREVQPKPITILPPLVSVVVAEPTEHQFTVSSQGAVQPLRDIQLVAEVAGRVVSVAPSLAAGGFFEEGEVLVRIDPRDYELALTQAQAQVRQAEVRRERELAEAEVARSEWNELGKGEASPLLLRKPQLAEAEAVVQGANAALEQAKLNLERCQVQAPFAGRVWEKGVDLGQFVNRGTVIARLYSVDYAEVRLPLPLQELEFIGLPVDYRAGPGQPEPPTVSLSADVAGSEQVWTGTIVRMEGEIDPRSRMATLVAQVDDPYHRLRKTPAPVLPVGLFVEASIRGRQLSEVFVLPRTVLRGRDSVLVVNEASRLEIRKVKVLRANRATVVVQSGINRGEKIVSSLLDTAENGMQVRVAGDAAAGAADPAAGGESGS